MTWNHPQYVHTAARAVSGAGWLLAFMILVIGTVMAARNGHPLELALRAAVSGAILVVTAALAWLMRRYADRDGGAKAAP